MLEYDKIDVLEGIDVDMTNKSKECVLCHYWYFLDKNFSQNHILDQNHIFAMAAINIMQKCNKFKNIAIVHIKKVYTEFILCI